MSSQILVGAVAQALLAVIVGWVAGDVLLHAAFSRNNGRIDLRGPLPDEIGVAEKGLAALVGFIAFSIGLMLFHIASGGAVFGLPGIVPAAALAVVLWGARHRVWDVRAIPWVRVAAFIAIISLLYIVPAVWGGSSIRTGDDPWHLGWTQQLLDGMPVPVGPAPVDANAYPWGFHAVMATMARMVPGTTPVTSLEALHMLIALSIPLAAACLARCVDRRAGLGAAAAAALIGGFGWVLARGPAFLTSPRHPVFGADLTAASPNGLYELLPPPLPRELGLALLGAAAVTGVWATRRGGRAAAVLCGVTVGLVGLVSIPMLLCALVWVLAAALVGRSDARGTFLIWTLIPAAALFALWAAPVGSAYVRYGGFVNITPHLGEEWPVVTALGSWGLLLPLAVAGLVAAIRSPDGRGRTVVAFTTGSTILLVLAVVRAMFGWNLGGNATVLHEGRVWPPLHLLGAVLGGIVLARLWTLVDARRRAAGAALSVLILAVGAISPVLASVQLTRVIRAGSSGFGLAASQFDPRAFAARAASRLGSSDVVRVRGARSDPGAGLLAFTLFDLSGARLSAYDNPKLPGNDLRIRYRDLAARWDARADRGGYRADYSVIPCPSACAGALETGVFGGVRWGLYPGRPPAGG